MGRKKHAAHGGGGHAPLWMVSWADMATLLMCFFVLMVAFADVNEGKAREAMKSIQVSLTRPWPFASKNFVLPIDKAYDEKKGKKKADDDLDKARRRIQDVLRMSGITQAVQVELGKEGLTLITLSPVFFEQWKAEILPASFATLGTIGEFLREYKNEVRIEGHTSQVEPPSGGEFADNWELAGARAKAILHYLIEKHSIDPKRMVYASFGSNRPRVPFESTLGQKLNDRIEIKLITEEEGEDTASYLKTRHERIPDNTEIVVPDKKEPQSQ